MGPDVWKMLLGNGKACGVQQQRLPELRSPGHPELKKEELRGHRGKCGSLTCVDTL